MSRDKQISEMTRVMNECCNEVYCINKNDLKAMNFVVDQIAKEMLGENINDN